MENVMVMCQEYENRPNVLLMLQRNDPLLKTENCRLFDEGTYSDEGRVFVGRLGAYLIFCDKTAKVIA